jgi:hypothetical protein
MYESTHMDLKIENFYKPYVFSKFMCMGLIFLVVIVV